MDDADLSTSTTPTATTTTRSPSTNSSRNSPASAIGRSNSNGSGGGGSASASRSGSGGVGVGGGGGGMYYGTLSCVAYCEFDNALGPLVVHQAPEGFMSRDEFMAVSKYVIPKDALCGTNVGIVDTRGRKLTGFPILIAKSKYSRNALLFNVIFVLPDCVPWDKSVQYDDIVKTLNNYLLQAEQDASFLSKADTKATLPKLLNQVLEELNNNGVCTLQLGGIPPTTLKLAQPVQIQPQYLEQIPFCFKPTELMESIQSFSLPVRQLLPYITDGLNHVKKISAMSGLDLPTVQKYLDELIAENHVGITEVYHFAHHFCVTPRIHILATNTELQEECVRYVAAVPDSPPRFSAIFAQYARLRPGVNFSRDTSVFRAQNIDPHQLIKFGLLNDIIRHVPSPETVFDSVCRKVTERSIFREPDWSARYFV
ncbi:GATOR complex protein NPRL2 [Pelomyxa schiedti]|nr:GATOR complex protein NPRL2 [Pelomyxa schiedti]KAH3760731.1 GATOR complex protein NPRL2 [Pelomyxa schiedti]